MKTVSRAGFTLIELLITMSVIAVIVSAGFMTIARGTDERALERGADMLHSMVRVARTQAITNGRNARLIISLDKADPDFYLRRIGVMVEDELQNHWIAVDRGTVLPEGVFVVPQSGQINFPSDWPSSGRRSIYKLTNNDSDEEGAVYQFDYPLAEPVDENTTNATEWMCIQFSPNGRLSSAQWGGGGLEPLSNQLIIAKGGWTAGKVNFLSAQDFIGIAFKRGGSSYRTKEAELVDDEED